MQGLLLVHIAEAQKLPLSEIPRSVEVLNEHLKTFQGRLVLYKQCIAGRCPREYRAAIGKQAFKDGVIAALTTIILLGGAWRYNNYRNCRLKEEYEHLAQDVVGQSAMFDAPEKLRNLNFNGTFMSSKSGNLIRQRAYLQQALLHVKGEKNNAGHSSTIPEKNQNIGQSIDQYKRAFEIEHNQAQQLYKKGNYAQAKIRMELALRALMHALFYASEKQKNEDIQREIDEEFSR